MKQTHWQAGLSRRQDSENGGDDRWIEAADRDRAGGRISDALSRCNLEAFLTELQKG